MSDTPRVELSAEQVRVVEAACAEVWVTAAAGSGKTRCLVERVARRIQGGADAGGREEKAARASSTVAFTFTRKAARQMEDRLRRHFRERGDRDALRAMEQLRVGTIDSFCAQALREHAAEAGLDPQFQLQDELEARLLERQIARKVLAAAASAAASNPTDALRGWLNRLEPDSFVDYLVSVATRIRNAGSAGQLLAAWRKSEGHDVESFTASQATRRLHLQHQLLAAISGALDACAGHPSRKDAHRAKISEATGQLAGETWAPVAWKLLREGLALAGSAADKEDFQRVRAAAWEATEPAGVVGKFKKVSDQADDALFPMLLAFVDVLEAYLKELEREKRRGIPQLLDYQDVQLEVVGLARDSEVFRSYCRERIGELLVDELQDINGLQSDLLESLQIAPGRVFGVGDPMQSIYRFRHSDVVLFQERLLREPGAERASEELKENYRSVPGVIRFVNAAFPRILALQACAAAQAAFRPLVARRPEVGGEGPSVELLTVDDDGHTDADAADRALAEARVVAGRLRELHESRFQVCELLDGQEVGRDLEWKDIAILVRTRKAAGTYQRALTEAGVPWETDLRSDLLETVEGRDLVQALEVLWNPRNDLALVGLLRSPFVDLSEEGLIALGARVPRGPGAWWDLLRDPGVGTALEAPDSARLQALLAALPGYRDRVFVEGASGVLRDWVWASGYLPRQELRGGGARVAANVDLFLEECRRREPWRGDLAGLLERLRFMREEETSPGEGGVLEGHAVGIHTIHEAKGLEFPVVVVPQLGRRLGGGPGARAPVRAALAGRPRALTLAAECTPGFARQPELRGWAAFLLGRDEDAAEREEEIRLFYVAATRARDHLLLAGARKARNDGRMWEKRSCGMWLEQALEQLGPEAKPLLRRTATALSDIRGSARKEASRLLVEQLPAEVSEEELAGARDILGQAQRPLPEGSLRPRDIGAADLARALQCPWRYRLRDYLDQATGAALRGAGSGDSRANERGSQVHDLLSLWDPAQPLELQWDALADRVGLAGKDRDDVRTWLSQPVVLEALDAMRRPGVSLRRELPFEWRLGRTRVSGRLDALVTLEDGSLAMLDYKTDRGEELLEQYDLQTAIYSAAVERAGLGRVSVRRLIYLRRGHVRDLPWEPGSTERLEARILALLPQLLSEAAPAPACESCPLAKANGAPCPARVRRL